MTRCLLACTLSLRQLVAWIAPSGLAAGYAYWDNQDVWTVGDNGWATLVAGFTASTTGALAGVTAALFSPNSGGGGEAKEPAGRTGDRLSRSRFESRQTLAAQQRGGVR